MRRKLYRRAGERAASTAAKDLRVRMTDAERILWSVLHLDRIGGQRFRRQHGTGPFVLDFYCASVKLAIELDGPVHDPQREHDQARTETLETLQIRALAFETGK